MSVCVSEGLVICGCVYVWVLLCVGMCVRVGFVTCVCVCVCVYVCGFCNASVNV